MSDLEWVCTPERMTRCEYDKVLDERAERPHQGQDNGEDRGKAGTGNGAANSTRVSPWLVSLRIAYPCQFEEQGQDKKANGEEGSLGRRHDAGKQGHSEEGAPGP